MIDIIQRRVDMTQGVLFLNSGEKCMIRLLVAVQSLRRHYSGDITLFQYGQYPIWFKTVLDTFKVNIRASDDMSVHPLVRKSMLWRDTPYDVNLFIDADTITLKPIDWAFRKVLRRKFAVTHFCNWKSSGQMISGRIKGFKKVCTHKEIRDAIEWGSAVNVGIFAFCKDSPMLPEWEKLTKLGKENNCSRIPDELACQVLCPRFPPKLLPSTWGISVRFATEQEIKDAVIVHYHGMKHCQPDLPLCRLWENEYMELCAKFAIPELRMPWGDKRLGRFQKRQFSEVSVGIRRVGGRVEYPLTEPINSDNGLSQNKEEPTNGTKETKVPLDGHVVGHEITYVTAVNEKYLDRLKKNYPLWMKVKGVRKKPFIVFARPDVIDKLTFLNRRATIIPWAYGLKEGYSERESMLTAFIKAIGENVKTPYWCKIDADSTPKVSVYEWDKVIDNPWDYDIIGNRWGYTKSKGGYEKKHFLNILDEWWNIAMGHEPLFPPNLPYEKRYSHKRIASYICLHKTEFSKEVAELVGDNRLPIPSHDTLIWYIATRLGKKIGGVNMRRYFRA